MDDQFVIRKATINDIDFITETIIEAEKSGTDKIVTPNIFNLTEQEYREILREVLMMDITDYEYSLSGFSVFQHKGKILGALGSWIEGKAGIASSMIKGSILASFLKEENIVRTKKLLTQLKEFSFLKTNGSIQIEYAYVLPEYRRKKIFSRLIIYTIKNHLLENKSLQLVETSLMKDNYKSYNCYCKLGFKVTNEITLQSIELIDIFPFSKKILLVKDGKGLTDLINQYDEMYNITII